MNLNKVSDLVGFSGVSKSHIFFQIEENVIKQDVTDLAHHGIGACLVLQTEEEVQHRARTAQAHEAPRLIIHLTLAALAVDTLAHRVARLEQNLSPTLLQDEVKRTPAPAAAAH